MSGIFGVLALDGREPSGTDLDAMAAVLERRGPDGTHRWQSGNVALGHTLLATTPEALVEVLPFTDPASGCTITADCRLDNREELLSQLDLAVADRVIGDGELILRAYLEWGEDCPAKLLGDFAFAIWDPRGERLFCARDHMGMRQFNFCYVPGRIFAFATEDTAVVTHPEVPGDLDEGRIADLIDDLEGIDLTSTFFEVVQRLPPAHWLAVTSRTYESRHYWTLLPGRRLQLATDEAYAEAFLGVFTEAVRCRLRTTGGVAAMLSGGLDSSAVAVVAGGILSNANRGPLTTISAVSSDPAQCPETRAIKSAQSIAGLRPISINVEDLGGMADQLIAALDEPRNPFEVHGTMLRCIYGTARENGVNVVLDGGSGDVILSSDNRIASLLATGKLKAAFREVAGQRRFWNPARPARFVMTRFVSAAWVAFGPLALRGAWRRLRISGRIAGVKPGFLKQVRFAERRRRADRQLRVVPPADPMWRTQVILHPNLVSGRERYEQLAASFAVESRDPFMDLRVIDFCLSLPPEQLETEGWPKIILRRALAKRAPDDIAWRRGKEHLGWAFTTRLLSAWKGWQHSMCDPLSPLGRYLSPTTLQKLRARRDRPPVGPDMSLFALDRFLRNHGPPSSVD